MPKKRRTKNSDERGWSITGKILFGATFPVLMIIIALLVLGLYGY